MKNTKSLNSYSNHGLKKEWLPLYFSLKDEFKEKQASLGSNMVDFFFRFLKDANLVENGKFSKTADIIEKIGLNKDISWAIMLTNLSYAPQIGWYIKNIHFNITYKKDAVILMLENEGVNDTSAKQMLIAYKRIFETPFGKDLGLGCIDQEGRDYSITRSSWGNPDPKVILYGLYKFAENCGNYNQFTLSRLMDYVIESDGVSPSLIFGIDEETMTKILNGLSVNYPEFITVGFTHDLDNISLNSEKTSSDVLNLFIEGC